ncbi:MAG: hypothetical protein A2Y15_00730 [Clostridiales bacterium GWF2_36_10]|nr:MAG: hypothetical protein A2Y15_00730 [Clostridiales bacterium GWF2_36_10]HAN21507.1 hypothetical protein [Clostridiales bacterium]
MFFLFATVLTASFLICAEFSAICFISSILLTVFYLYLFSLYFFCCQKTAVFVPLILVSLSMHITFFLIELHKSYIKDVNIWVLALFLVVVCGFMAYGTRSKTGVAAITYMASPVFIILSLLSAIAVLTGKLTLSPLFGENIYQYVFTVVSPPSTAIVLTYMHRCRFKKIFPAFVTSIAISICFFLFDAPFFKATTLNFIAPFIIASEMLLLKETILPSEESKNLKKISTK